VSATEPESGYRLHMKRGAELRALASQA